MASRLAFRCTKNVPAHVRYSCGLLLSSLCAPERRKQALPVPRRAQQVSRLHEPGEFARRNECNIARSSSPNNYCFLLVHYLIENVC